MLALVWEATVPLFEDLTGGGATVGPGGGGATVILVLGGGTTGFVGGTTGPTFDSGQIVVEIGMVDVIVLAGQFVTSGAHDVMVIFVVV